MKINKSIVPKANKIPENTFALVAEISPLTKGLFLVLAILLSISTSKIWLMTALEEAIKAIPKSPKITLDKSPEKPSAKNIEVAAVNTSK